jgi:oligopeptidase A
MTYLDDRAIRSQLWEAYNSRATEAEFDNRGLVREILKLRRQKARLLGFRDFADLVLEERMAHDGTAALVFLEDLRTKTEAHFQRENRELVQWAQENVLLPHGADPEPWDIAYLAEKQRLALYNFDEEELRPYFPLEQVMAGMFDIFSRLFSIRVVPEPGVPGWDPAVRYFRIEDADSGLLLGGFYSDWFPRENKRGGAWMDGLVTGNPDAGQPHVGVICGNLTPPVEDKPSLLTHREVETIFHEFGHLLHHILSRVPVRTLAGTNVPWDFVELPSQIMENWCMEREALNRFARHYQTGDPIPQELFEKMYRARTFRAANAQMRQLGFGMVDLLLHREFDPDSPVDVMSYARNILARFSAAPLPSSYAMIASFTHLFSSPVAYGAGYYSYKWAEVLDADAFTRFRREGVFNAETGLAYRRTILERGDSEEPAALFREFMGRDPDPGALLERLGLRAA